MKAEDLQITSVSLFGCLALIFDCVKVKEKKLYVCLWTKE